MEEASSQRSRSEHAKFLLFQIKEILNGVSRQEDTCILQCKDGSLPLPSLLLAGLSPLFQELMDSTEGSEQSVLILPELEMGEVMLFLKYLLSVNVEKFFAHEDTFTIRKVGKFFEADFEVSKAIREDIKSSKVVIKKHFQKAVEEKVKKAEEKSLEMKSRVESMACPFCQFPINLTVVAKHLKTTHPELEYACLECKENFSTRSCLEEHVQLHPDSQWYKACKLCPLVSLTIYQHQVHHRSTHNDKQATTCKHCDKAFVKTSALKKHEEQHELGKFTRTYACVQCPKTFGKPSNLTRHLRSHFGIKGYSCDECSAEFVDSTRLKEHKWIHLDYNKFKCPLDDCPQTFRHRSNLRNHMTKAHNGPEHFPCPLCSRNFAFEYKLRNHLRLHDMDEEARKKETTEETFPEFKDSSVYVCASCKREFKTIDDLGVHCKEFHKPEIDEPNPKKRKLTSVIERSLPVTDTSGLAHNTQGGVQPVVRSMPTLDLNFEGSKNLHLDAETKKHLQTLEEIRLESNEGGGGADVGAVPHVRLEYLNDLSINKQNIILPENMRLNAQGQIIMEVNHLGQELF